MAFEIALERLLPAPAEAVWPLLTEPARMNDWSEAPVEALATGDGGRMDTVGALRRVTAPGPTGDVRLLEVIARSDPPRSLVYRVVKGPAMVKAHRGEQRLEPLGSGQTRLRWNVQIELHSRMAEPLARRSLVPALERSLDALASRAEGAAVEPVRPAPALAPPSDTAELLRDARAIRDAQGALAAELRAAGDPKWAFARVYELVSEAQLDLVASGTVDHPDWVLALIPRFDGYYARNLTAWRSGRALDVETPWARSFAATEGGSSGRAIAAGLYFGIRAHIEEDLPRALADVWLARYRGRCDYARFRADYLSMGELFEVTSERLMAELPTDAIPAWMRAARSMLPGPARSALSRSQGYDVFRARAAAFERGRRLAAWKEPSPG